MSDQLVAMVGSPSPHSKYDIVGRLERRFEGYRTHQQIALQRYHKTFEAMTQKQAQETMMLKQHYLTNNGHANGTSKSKQQKSGNSCSGNARSNVKRANASNNSTANNDDTKASKMPKLSLSSSSATIATVSQAETKITVSSPSAFCNNSYNHSPSNAHIDIKPKPNLTCSLSVNNSPSLPPKTAPAEIKREVVDTTYQFESVTVDAIRDFLASTTTTTMNCFPNGSDACNDPFKDLFSEGLADDVNNFGDEDLVMGILQDIYNESEQANLHKQQPLTIPQSSQPATLPNNVHTFARDQYVDHQTVNCTVNSSSFASRPQNIQFTSTISQRPNLQVNPGGITHQQSLVSNQINDNYATSGMTPQQGVLMQPSQHMPNLPQPQQPSSNQPHPSHALSPQLMQQHQPMQASMQAQRFPMVSNDQLSSQVTQKPVSPQAPAASIVLKQIAQQAQQKNRHWVNNSNGMIATHQVSVQSTPSSQVQRHPMPNQQQQPQYFNNQPPQQQPQQMYWQPQPVPQQQPVQPQNIQQVPMMNQRPQHSQPIPQHHQHQHTQQQQQQQQMYWHQTQSQQPIPPSQQQQQQQFYNNNTYNNNYF